MPYQGLSQTPQTQPTPAIPTGGGSSVKGYQGLSVSAPAPKTPVIKTTKTVVPFAPGQADKYGDLAKMFQNTIPVPSSPKLSTSKNKTTKQIENLKGKNEVISQGKKPSVWDNIKTGTKNFFKSESDPHQFASMAVQQHIVDTQLVDMAKQIGLDKQFPKDPMYDDLTSSVRQKKEIARYMRDNYDDIKVNFKNAPDHPELLGPEFDEVNKNLDQYTKEIGIRQMPTNSEVITILLTAPITMTLVAPTTATIVGTVGTIALIETAYHFMGGTLSDKVADALGLNSGTRDVLSLVEVFGVGKALHTVYKKAPQLATKYTKDIITQFAPGTTVKFKPEQIRDIFQTGKKMSPEEVSLWNKLGRTPEQVKRDIANGVTIEIPPEKLISVVDKPYWAKLKNIIGIESKPILVSRTPMGEAKESFTQKLLPSGETKLQTITKDLIAETKKNVAIHGSEKTALALSQNLGIEAGLAAEVIRVSQTASLIDDAKLISQNILKEVNPQGYQGIDPAEIASLETIAKEKTLPTEETVTKVENVEAPKVTELSPDMQARKTGIDARRDYFDNNPLNQLIKYQSSSRPGELPEFTGTGKGQFGKDGDKIIDEIMGYKDAYKNANDVAEVSKRFESYMKEKKAYELEETQLKKDIAESKREAASINVVAESVKEPVIEGPRSELKSRVFERLQAEQGDKLEGDLLYDKNTREKDVEGALKLLESDPEQAFRVAMNAEAIPETTSTMMNIAMSEKALQEGNVKLFAQLTRNRSLAQTRRGQEIEAEKASVTNNSTSRYVKELLQTRLDNLGNEYLTKVGSTTKRVAKGKVKGGSPKERAIERIDKEVAKAQKQIPKSSKELDLAEAQKIIDSLTC